MEKAIMTEAVGTCIICSNFVDFMKELPWCKQPDGTLVAVTKCTPEIIVALSDHELTIMPGGMKVKMQKSWLSDLQEKNENGLPVPVLMVWKKDEAILSYRRHKSYDYPYDSWSDPAAAAYEMDQFRLPAAHFGSKFQTLREGIITTAKACPAMIPQQ